MKIVQKKCEKLKKHKKKLEQEIVNLKSHMEKNMIECGQIEQYKWEIEERTKQDLVEKLKQINLFLQVIYLHYISSLQLYFECIHCMYSFYFFCRSLFYNY